MTRTVRQALAISAFGLAATVTAADPPAPLPVPAKKLKDEADALAKEREQLTKELAGDAADGPAVAERVKLRVQLLELVKRLEEKKFSPRPKAAEPAPPPVKGKVELPPPGAALDSVRLAANLYRAGDADAALRAFRLIDPAGLSREDRAFVSYMTACCLRKQGKLPEAAVLYREVADRNEDEFVTECAVWQLGVIRSTQDLEGQLEQLRSRRKSR